MLTELVRERLEDQVAALAQRTRPAADLSELVKTNALPASPVFAFVLPLGMNAGAADASAGAFRQEVSESVAVLLGVNRAGDPAGGNALPAIDELIAATIAALCGWEPDPSAGSGPFINTGDFALAQGQLLDSGSGLVLYQLDFIIPRQVRILS